MSKNKLFHFVFLIILSLIFAIPVSAQNVPEPWQDSHVTSFRFLTDDGETVRCNMLFFAEIPEGVQTPINIEAGSYHYGNGGQGVINQLYSVDHLSNKFAIMVRPNTMPFYRAEEECDPQQRYVSLNFTWDGGLFYWRGYWPLEDDYMDTDLLTQKYNNGIWSVVQKVQYPVEHVRMPEDVVWELYMISAPSFSSLEEGAVVVIEKFNSLEELLAFTVPLDDIENTRYAFIRIVDENNHTIHSIQLKGMVRG